MRKYLIDPPLVAFVLLMVAAATITSHGTLTFYRYILPEFWAWAAMVVITAGIPLLELAAVLDRVHRLRYVAGMVVLLGLEGLAQYFQGQALFLPSVLRQFPNPRGIDLATFASEPRGRVLVVVFLAMLSLVVVYFGYAASLRIREIRASEQAVEQNTTELEQLSTWLEQSKAEAEHERARAEQAEHERTQLLEHAERLKENYMLTASEVERRQRVERDLLARAEAAEDALEQAAGVDLSKLAAVLSSKGATQREIAAVLGVSNGTVSNWLSKAKAAEQASRNGKHEEVVA